MNRTTVTRSLRTARCVALALAAATTPPLVAQAPQTSSLSDTRTVFKPKPVPGIVPSQRLAIDVGAVGRMQLPPVDVARLLAEDLAAPRADRMVRYGVARDVVVLLDDGSWSFVPPNAFHWAVDITSPGAIGLRLRLNLDLPERSYVVAYSPSDPDRVHGPYSARGPFDDGQVWTPTTFGDTVRVEFLISAPAPPDAGNPPFIIDRLQHVYRDPIAEGAAAPGQDGGCHNDPTCYGAWTSTANAVGGVGTIQGDALFCTGQLLNSQNGDLTPYLLTANHCVGSSSEAQSTEIYWKYQSSTCGGPPPSLASVPQSAVTTLLATKAGIGTYDFSLLMVEGGLPGGLTWAGWNAGTISNGTDVTGIHHPQGTYKRISFGNKIAIGDPDLVQVAWYDGPTEPGSSGSGLFVSSSQQLIGQLSTGSSDCGLIGGGFPDQYGAFSKTYLDVSGLLAGGSDDGFENNDTCAAAAAVGDGTSNGLVVKSTDEDWYSITLPAGNQLNVNLGFTHAWGDVDMKLFSACGGTQLAIAESATNNEFLSYTNATGSQQVVRLQVYLYSDTRNQYSMTISGSSGGGPSCSGTGDCCTGHATPGCSDPVCCETVCACDPYCCATEWDQFCAGGGYQGSGCGAALLCPACSGLPNDDCSGAILVGEGSIAFDTTGATTDGPNEPGQCDFFGYTQVGSDVWYRYVPSCTGNATISLCSSAYDTKLAVYAGASCPGAASAVACNDDACGPGQGLQSQVVLPVVAGSSYLIRIGGYNGATGSGTLSISCDGGGPACQPSLGFQGPGSATLTVCGDTSSGGTATFDLTGGPPNVPAFLVYSLSSTGVPFGGGTLLPYPNYFVLSFTTNGAGAVSLTINGGGGPVVVYCQFALKLSASSWWLSNAVAVTILP